MFFSEDSHQFYEQQDIAIFQKDSTEVIENIMDAYGDEIKKLIYTYVKNTADTDDITQEVFITIHQKLDTFKGKSSLKSWIYSIAINKCKDYLRKWQFRNKKLKDTLTNSVHISKIQVENPIDFTIKKEEAQELLDSVMKLSVKYREIIVLYYLKDLSIKEISYILNVKEPTVRTRLLRGRDKLKNLHNKER
ncbi:sigma-70 family RNA polymerase sigma factor [Virgibacillus sp. AGTR]|uniref:sigma-70 family RNA polymerase sigma factor n=1 Tax=Virgibacillus sp. AGTR TaxID=2812055 RepID=UPI001D16F8B4|nr:sigma-70 family RNA polymerase sigma factor [Virgibacillus sp. AGTR]MCC2248892.1 sigma-70 family RNA polymerase sigma factor [Virgibacillus sp. AGTR]